MGFLIYCTNKGCGEQVEPLLDTSSDEVYCTSCNKVMLGVTHFAKVQMKALGQVKKAVKQTTPFQITCPGCKQRGTPNVKNGVTCSSCGINLEDKISKPILHALKQSLQ